MRCQKRIERHGDPSVNLSPGIQYEDVWAIADFVEQMWERKGRGPTFAEIAEHMQRSYTWAAIRVHWGEPEIFRMEYDKHDRAISGTLEVVE